jgi:hypothetical protein
MPKAKPGSGLRPEVVVDSGPFGVTVDGAMFPWEMLTGYVSPRHSPSLFCSPAYTHVLAALVDTCNTKYGAARVKVYGPDSVFTQDCPFSSQRLIPGADLQSGFQASLFICASIPDKEELWNMHGDILLFTPFMLLGNT